MTILHTPICDLLEIEYPIVLAGMGSWGMGTPPELVAAVSNAGGLGVLGCSNLPAAEIDRRIAAVRSLTDKPFGVDLLLPASLAQASGSRAAVRREIREKYPEHWAFLTKLHQTFGLPERPFQEDHVISTKLIQEQIEVTLNARVPVFAAGLGDPAIVVPEAREVGMKVIGVCGSPRNAIRQVKAGVDVIVAQGTEGGGHTGAIANFALLPQVVDAAGDIPVLAAGGIFDGRGVAASLALGAQGAWIGTAFLVANEGGLPESLKDQLVNASTGDMRVSPYWTGKPVRAVHNEVSQAWSDSGLPALPTPHQRVLMEDFKEAAMTASRFEITMNAGGQGAGGIRSKRPAAEIFNEIIETTRQTLDSLKGL
jgi:nitronate monooxygenase